MNPILSILSLTLLFHLHFSKTLAQSPTASPASPPGPTSDLPDITKILKKEGHFNLFLRLLKSTNVGETINSQLSNSNNGLTVFAPSDTAFSSLGLGTLNSLTAQQQIQLVQFHILPTFFSTTQLQTVSNPLRTQAGENGPGQFPLNVTTVGGQENLSTGVMNTSVSAIVYDDDDKLAVYRVDRVLLPSSIFGALMGKKMPEVAAESPSSDGGGAIGSSGVSLTMQGMVVVSIGMGLVGSFLF